MVSKQQKTERSVYYTRHCLTKRQFYKLYIPLYKVQKPTARTPSSIQRLVQILDNIVNMLNPDRQTDIAIRNPGRNLVLGR